MLCKTIIPAAFLSVLAMPVLAQDTGDPLSPPPAMDEGGNDAMMGDTMSPEQQAQYAAWPAEVRDYYDMLSPERQELFWTLSDADKVSLVAMSPDDQEAVWQGIESLPKGSSPRPE